MDHVQVAKLQELMAAGVASAADMAAASSAGEQLNTLRESNAHLRVLNRELQSDAARAAREAQEARNSVVPLQERIT